MATRHGGSDLLFPDPVIFPYSAKADTNIM